MVFLLGGIPISSSASSQQLDESKRISKTAGTVNPALQSESGPLSSLSSINLFSVFNDTRAEIKMAFSTKNSLISIGAAQSFSKKQNKANLLDQNGMSSGTTLSFSFQTKTKLFAAPRPFILKEKEGDYQTFKEGIKTHPVESVNDLSDVERQKLIDLGIVDLRGYATPLLFNFQLSASRVAFDYIADTLATRPLASAEMNKSVSFGFSRFTSLDAFWALTYSAIYAFQSGNDLISYSFPIGGKGLTYAKDVTVGIPTEKFESKLKLEGRKILRNKARVAVAGINPSISMLFRAEKVNIDVPVYFLTRGDNGILNGLQAGFRVGYTSKADDSFFRDLGSFNSDKMYFSLFLSKPFSMQ